MHPVITVNPVTGTKVFGFSGVLQRYSYKCERKTQDDRQLTPEKVKTGAGEDFFMFFVLVKIWLLVLDHHQFIQIWVT